MKRFLYELSLCLFSISSCVAMEKIWYKSEQASADDYRDFLEKRDIKMSKEEFALFKAGLDALDSRSVLKHGSIFQNSDSESEGDGNKQPLMNQLKEEANK